MTELGSVLYGHVLIGDPRWRLVALVRLVPVIERFSIAPAKLCSELATEVRHAYCPEPLRELLADRLVAACDPARSLLGLVDALWSRTWHGAVLAAATAELGRAFAFEVRDHATSRTWLALHGAVRRGFAPGRDDLPRFVDSLRWRCAEQNFLPSLPLLIHLVDAIAHDRDRVDDAERVLAGLPERDRLPGIAHVARLALRFDGPAAALRRVRSIKPRGVRGAAGLLLARAALPDVAVARELAAAIEPTLMRQRAELDIVRTLVRRGDLDAAVALLGRLDTPPLAAECQVVRDEIALAIGGEVPELAPTLAVERVRRRRVLPTRRNIPAEPRWANLALRAPCDAAALEPGWAQLAPRSVPSVRRWLVRAVYALRHGSPVRAGDIVRREVTTSVARGELLDLLALAGLDVREAILGLRRAETMRVVDALLAEHVGRCADAVTAVPAATAAGLRNDAQAAPCDPRSLDRALFDEALAISGRAAPRRRVLIGVARRCLREALVDPTGWTRDTIEARLRTLVQLGGELGRGAIAKPLATLPLPAVFAGRAFAALCAIDARAAAAIALARIAELRASGGDVPAVLAEIERHRGLPLGFAHAYERARVVVGDGFLAALGERWRARTATQLPVALLACLADRRIAATTPDEVLAELDRVVDVAGEHVGLARHLARDATLLDAVLLARPPRIDPQLPVWTLAEWQGLLRAAVGSYRDVDRHTADRCAALLGFRRHADALRAGDLRRLGVPTVADAGAFQIRLLDKRDDLPTYLRFADQAIASCYRSDSSSYLQRYYGTRDAVIEAWKDPLTFCFLIERDGAPRGFCFGGFAAIGEAPAILLNGIYLRQRDPEVRAAIVHAIERSVCAPLRVWRVGIAAVHGGFGSLPATYRKADVTLTRLRALAWEGQPVTWANDDISTQVNVPIAARNLWWRN